MRVRPSRRRLYAALIANGMAFAACLGVLTGIPVSSAAAGDSVLILEGTVIGGASSIEASEVVAKGLTPVVVDDSRWAAMTTAEFASYRAIILGDPSCGGIAPSAAAANAATWGAAVTGNVVIVGTDAALHASQGGDALTRRGVDFAIDQPGKTGAYVTLSCYYHDTAAGTAVPLLDAFRPGGFTVTGVGCYNDAHMVATHPALAGLTDADLSNWSCSVHEAFDKWPADFTVLAIAKDFGASFTASDGAIGTPYILARGAGLRSFPLSLDPTSQDLAVGVTAKVTAQLLDGATSAPVAGSVLRFRVASGPNAGASATCAPSSCATDAAGQVAWSYRGERAGTDAVQTWLDTNGDGVPSPGEPQTTAAVTWTGSTALRLRARAVDWEDLDDPTNLALVELRINVAKDDGTPAVGAKVRISSSRATFTINRSGRLRLAQRLDRGDPRVTVTATLGSQTATTTVTLYQQKLLTECRLPGRPSRTGAIGAYLDYVIPHARVRAVPELVGNLLQLLGLVSGAVPESETTRVRALEYTGPTISTIYELRVWVENNRTGKVVQSWPSVYSRHRELVDKLFKGDGTPLEQIGRKFVCGVVA